MKESLQNTRKKFIDKWKNRGNEDQDSQAFWFDLFSLVLDVGCPTDYLNFEKRVEIDGAKKKIDIYVPAVNALVEQKSYGKSLSRRYRQSDGTNLTPFEQARRYGQFLPHDENPRWILTSNFEEIWVYDNNKPGSPPEIIKTEDLEKDWTRLSFLINEKDEHIEQEKEISVQAGELVGKLYDALLREYQNPTDPKTLESLNVLIVRLVFLLYADDSGIFETNQFFKYMENFREKPGSFRRELQTLFDILDTPEGKRDPYLDEELAAFPYVNGGLFATQGIEIPRLNEEIIHLLLDEACAGFDWSGISPTIFGAVFESTLNAESRRAGGMHYTSIENIHKVIDPLFLNDLKHELIEIRESENVRGSKTRALNRFIDKLAGIKVLDPACGSGNFLTETYLSLRRLENEALQELTNGQVQFVVEENTPIKVSIDQLYGIEINDFAVAVANTALIIAQNQMLKETETILRTDIGFLPLQTFENIHEGNALRMDWNEVLPIEECSYVLGNPPFVGHQWRSREQMEDMNIAFPDLKKYGKLDYVCSWYNKAVDYIIDTYVEVAFVSTNSIVQGESVGILWKHLKEKGLKINFAHQSFVWANETKESAHVHCVIIGFSVGKERKEKRIFTENDSKLVDHINGYLLDAPDIFLSARKKPISNVPPLKRGNQPTDNGNLILTEEEKEKLLKKEPQAEPLIRPFMMGKDFIAQKPRYCLWLLNANPKLVVQCPSIKERIKKVKDFRLSSKKAATRKKAQTPMLFDEIRECHSPYLAIPKVSSENRRYIPIGYLSEEIIAGDSLRVGENTNLFLFGVLTSNVHNAWMRVVSGRLKSDYSYSNTIVYNNFPFPEPDEKQKALIEKTAQNILDVREQYQDCSLADLYDETFMPPDLRQAHRNNDKAVMQAYGWNWKGMTEEDCVAELMKLYREKTAE